MSLPTNFTDAWWLVKSDPKDNLTKLTDPETGDLLKIMKQSVWTVQTARTLFNVTSFQDQMGGTRSSFILKTGPTSTVSISWTGKKFVCLGDTLTLSDPKTGEYQEEQTWVHYGTPVEVNLNQFSG